MLDTMFDLPTFDGVDEVVIDKDVVEGRKTPVLVYAKSAKAEQGRRGLVPSSIPNCCIAMQQPFKKSRMQCQHRVKCCAAPLCLPCQAKLKPNHC